MLRVKGTQLRPERQFGQVGVELIGAESAESDAEAILMAVEALETVGVERMSVDLTIPLLVPLVCDSLSLSAAAQAELTAALDRKDAAAVAALGGERGPLLSELLATAGKADRALARLGRMDLPPAAAAERTRLGDVMALVRAEAPDLTLTVDPVENRGFAYHTGVSFTIFAPGVRGELGSGGRYVAIDGTLGEAGPHGEPATGFTLYVDTILRVLPDAAPPPSVFVPLGTDPGVAKKLRAEGWTTVAGLAPCDDAAAEAVRLECTHVYIAGKVVPAEGKA